MGAEVGRFERFVFFYFVRRFVYVFWDSNFWELIDSC